MTINEVEAIRAQSKAGKSGPWVSHFDEMAKKTVIRRLFKYLPVSIEMQTAIGLDEQTDAGVHQHNEAVISGDYMVMDDEEPEEEPANKTESVKNKLRQSAPAETESPATEEETGEITYAFVAEKINTATTQDDLELAADLINAIKDKGQKDELIKLAGQKRKEVEAA